MAEKKFGLGTALIISAVAAGIAGGVASYIKREEIKKLAEDIISRVKPADGADDEFDDWDISHVAEAEDADAADVNIVDSGISLESVESPAEDAADETESEAADETAPEDAPESVEDNGGQPDAEAGESEAEQEKKKTWFWSK